MPGARTDQPVIDTQFRLHGFGRGAVSNDRPYRASHRVLLSLTDSVEKVFSGKRMTFLFAAEAPRV